MLVEHALPELTFADKVNQMQRTSPSNFKTKQNRVESRNVEAVDRISLWGRESAEAILAEELRGPVNWTSREEEQ